MIAFFILAIAFVATMIALWLLHWHRQKTYRPTKAQIRKIVLASISETIDQETFDRFSSVPIGYNRNLEAVRKKYLDIVHNPECVDRVVSPELVVPLKDIGKERLRQLIGELDETPD
jgi:hypothetical protein